MEETATAYMHLLLLKNSDNCIEEGLEVKNEVTSCFASQSLSKMCHWIGDNLLDT